MPITIIEPSPSGVVGPGLNVRVSTTFPAPLGPDDHWFLTLQDPEDTNTIVGHARKQFTTQLVDITMGTTDGVYHSDEVQHPRVSDGEPVRLVVELINGVDGHVMDSGQAVYTHDRRTGVIQVVTMGMPALGGFSADDRAIIKRIEGVAWLDLVDEFLPDIVDWIGDRVRGKPGKLLVVPPRTGSGIILPPPLAPWFTWVGLEYAVSSLPVGIGIDEGNPSLTEIEYMQLVRARLLADDSSPPEPGRWTRQLNEIELWGTDVPIHVQYAIAPGVEVTFWYLLQALAE